MALATCFERTTFTTFLNTTVEFTQSLSDTIDVFSSLPVVGEQNHFPSSCNDTVVIMANDIWTGGEDGQRYNPRRGQQRRRNNTRHWIPGQRQQAISQNHEIKTRRSTLSLGLVPKPMSNALQLLVIWLSVAVVNSTFVPDPVFATTFFELLFDLEANETAFCSGWLRKKMLGCFGWR